MTQMRTRLMAFCFSVWLLWPERADAALYPFAKVTLKVVDESGKPIEGAEAEVDFHRAAPPADGWGVRSHLRRGLTNAKGLWTVTDRGTQYIDYAAAKEGYYTTALEYRFTSRSLLTWRPWNPTLTVELRKKHNPVAMYVRDVRAAVPVVGKPFGVDLKKGDWTAPYGKGEISDIVFVATGRFKNWQDYAFELQITFPHPGDGMLVRKLSPVKGCRFRYDYEAPLSGYRSRWRVKVERKPQGGGERNTAIPKGQYGVFRVRTELAPDGSVNRALYGRLRQGIEISGYDYPKPFVVFTYYLNPTGSRSLEFSEGKNLWLFFTFAG